MSEIIIGKYRIDPVLFTKGFASGCGPHRCQTSCCSSGVFLDPSDRDAILAEKEGIKVCMDATQSTDESQWFDNTVEVDGDFPSGYAVGTNVVNDKCAFLREDGRCSVQVYSGERHGDPWKLKPFYCVAFPICIDNGVVTFDDYQQDNAECCSLVRDPEATIVDVCRAELEYVLGKDGYRDLQDLQRRHQQQESN